MQSSQQPKNTRSPTPPLLDSSIEDIDEFCIEQELDNLENIACATRKPHFLDYDSIPPPGFEDNCSVSTATTVEKTTTAADVYPNENIKLDKFYETDGEVSDFVLSNVMKMHRKKENKPIEDTTTNTSTATAAQPSTGVKKKKHFLDENAIPPAEYENLDEREHRSLDRNFERAREYEFKYERKHSLDRDKLHKIKEPSYTLTRFLEHDIAPAVHRGKCDRPGFTSMPANLGPKVECVYSLLSMLGCNDQLTMSCKFLELSKSPESCATLRHSRCIPLIVQIIYSDTDEQTKKNARLALHNVVNSHPDDKAGRREAKVLKHIEQITEYCETLKQILSKGEAMADCSEKHPSQAIGSLMKISFDEPHRNAMCELGALQAIANLVHYDHAAHGKKTEDELCILLRRYASMSLTNLTFGDGNNKALLCTNKDFMKALVDQLSSTADDLLQATASVLRNLSWRADNNMKIVLNEIGTVTALSKAVMKNKNENTLKALLSALWNLSAHCSTNKAEFCAVDGALAFLVDMLVYEGPSKTLTIVENAGGILRNVSSHIAVKEDYRKILRQRNCLGILLQQLSSESLTIVSNSCGTLWNLSARCPEDQQFLLDNKAVSMLSLLIHSKHKMISNGSNAALKNLLNFRPTGVNQCNLDPIAKSMRLKELPTLNVRRQRAFEQELDQNLSETCENIEVTTPPKEEAVIEERMTLEKCRQYPKVNVNVNRLTKSAIVPKSESKDSIVTTKSDSTYETSKALEVSSKTYPIAGTNLTEKSNSSDATAAPSNSAHFERPKPDHSNDKSNKNECSKAANRKPVKKSDDSSFHSKTTYQETDLDQITDFSLRYGELQNNEESDVDEVKSVTTNSTDAYGNDILLILEDSVKCYQTEGTPYIISNAASVSDLRVTKNNDVAVKSKPIKSGHVTIENSGVNTPEKPTKYCEEGTPGYFSNHDSFSSLDEADPECDLSSSRLANKKEKPNNEIDDEFPKDKPTNANEQNDPPDYNSTTPCGTAIKSPGNVDFAQETPLMFSRHSSLDSLSSVEEPVIADDRSSVISDFSRLASGIISPSEIPDSPTQITPHRPPMPSHSTAAINLRSVFQDEVTTFNDHFSCATSLSNLSIEDEPKIVDRNIEQNADAFNYETVKTVDSVVDRSNNGPDTDISDSDEKDDDMLLETCINMGMNRINRPQSKGSNEIAGVDQHNLSDDSGASNVGDDTLLEQCMLDGMQKSTSTKSKPDANNMSCVLPTTVIKEHPMGMMRKGGIPSYILSADEVSQFNVEDSPCSYSVLSGLSDITVGSSVAGLVKQRTSRIAKKSCPPKQPPISTTAAEDSLSSISVDSDEDENILNEAMAMGIQSKPVVDHSFALETRSNLRGNQSSVHQRQQHTATDRNDSLSSIESSDSNDVSILEQCIQAGMSSKETKHNSNVRAEKLPLKIASPKRSQLPTFHKTPSQIERERQKERERKDDALLMECIKAGMPKCGATALDARIEPPVHHVRQVLVASDYTERLANLNIGNKRSPLPKNGETTSATVLETTSVSAPNTVPGVEMNCQKEKKLKNDHYKHFIKQTIKIGSNNNNLTDTNDINHSKNSSDLEKSYENSILSPDYNILECSNEYPASKLSNMDFTNDSYHESSLEMEISNEFLMEQIEDNGKIDKHKDPDLMQKSVDRLTKELVSTAEFLRTSNGLADDNQTTSTVTIGGGKKSSSNNTWNEDTCPNDVSFPSISMTASMIASMNDDDGTFSDINQFKFDLHHSTDFDKPSPIVESNSIIENVENKPVQDASLEVTLKYDDLIIGAAPQSDSLSTIEAHSMEYDGLINNTNDAINFQVGGEVQHTFRDNYSNYLSSGPFSFDTSSNTMTNSTIIAMEATKLVAELRNMKTMGDSSCSLDLDNVGPPSGMDTVSMSGHGDALLYSPQLARSRKKSLPLGLMARRAVGQATNTTSMESVNSSCNLDNIKPPSIMDELLDSMISVASITSEIADHKSSQYVTSHYETACSDSEDTTILQSCLDELPNDSSVMQSDFSSAESTPRKVRSVRRTLTPRQKRQITKERYKTYTIAVDMIAKDLDQLANNIEDGQDATMNDVLVVTEDDIIVTIEDTAKNMSPRQRRLHDRDRFQTQVLNAEVIIQAHDNYKNLTNNLEHCESKIPVIDDCVSVSDQPSICALTERFKYIRDLTLNNKETITPITTTNPENHDMSSIDFEQNSETESCDQNHRFNEETYTILQKPKAKILKEPEIKTNNCVTDKVSPDVKAVRGKKKAAYVSPYSKSSIDGGGGGAKGKAATQVFSKFRNILPTAKVDKKPKIVPSNQTVTPPRSNLFANKSKLTNKMGAAKPGTAIPVVSPKKPPPKKPSLAIPQDANASLNRQGTFVKDESSNVDVPIVLSEPSTPSKLKLASYPNLTKKPMFEKTSAYVSKLRTPLQRSASTGATKIPPRTPSASSSSNDLQSRRSSTAVVPNIPNMSQRSNSQTTIRSAPTKRESQPNMTGNQNLTQPRRDITSRISSLWKKNDDAKAATPTANGKPPVAKRLIRSSTFDNTPDKKSKSKIQEPKSTPNGKSLESTGIVVRRVKTANSKLPDDPKRISRLGSFINVEEK